MFAADVYKLLEGTSDAAFVVTPDREICFWNAAAERLFGYTARDVRNRTFDEVLKSLGAPKGCSDSIPAFDLEVTTRLGQRMWVSISTIAFEDSCCHKRLVAHLSHDITRQKEAEHCFTKILELSKDAGCSAHYVPEAAPIESLSEQQQRILALFAQAKKSAQVATELEITVPTLRNHLHAINQKLRTHTRLEAVLHAMRRGLV